MTTDRTRVGPMTAPLPPYALVVPVLAGLGGAAFLAWEPGVARSMAASPSAVAFALLVGLVVLGAGWVLPRLGRGALLTVAVQALPVAAAFVLTVAPAFRFPRRCGDDPVTRRNVIRWTRSSRTRGRA